MQSSTRHRPRANLAPGQARPPILRPIPPQRPRRVPDPPGTAPDQPVIPDPRTLPLGRRFVALAAWRLLPCDCCTPHRRYRAQRAVALALHRIAHRG